MMKNRDGDEYYYEKIGTNLFKFNILSELKVMRLGHGTDPEYPDRENVLSFFDPSGGPFVEVGSKITSEEVLSGESGTVKRIMNTEEGIVVELNEK